MTYTPTNATAETTTSNSARSVDLTIEQRIADQVFGHSLEREFYLDEDVFRQDINLVLAGQWHVAAPTSAVPTPGDFLAVEVGHESIIIARDNDGQLHGHFNVCRHRGSRICPEGDGNAPSLVCPYHAWVFAHDGSLRLARQMPDSFDRSEHGLVPCRIEIFEGLIFFTLDPETAIDFADVAMNLRPFLQPHGLDRAQVATSRKYEISANWKLVVENFRECYHCSPAHPEYTAVNAYVRAGDKSLDGYAPVVHEWRETYDDPTKETSYREFTNDVQPHHAWRMPIRDGFLTGTQDGQPVAPLMGSFNQYDGAETVIFLSPLTYLYLNNDHAAVFRIAPRTAKTTDVIVGWLVHEDAKIGIDVDVEALTWLWHHTTLQDAQLVEDNARGVESRAYRTGPYSLREPGPTNFTSWYLATLAGDPTQRETVEGISDKGQ